MAMRLQIPKEIADDISIIVERTIDWYDQQLEIGYHFDKEGNIVNSDENERNLYPTGIEARDETIRLIENSNKDLVIRNHILKEALKFYARPDIYGINGGSSDYIIQDAGKTAKKALKLQKEVYRGRK